MRFLPTLVCTLVLGASAGAQVGKPGVPRSTTSGLRNAVPQVVLPTPDVDAYLAEDAINGPFPFRYGAILPAAIDIETDGVWDQTRTHLVWRVEVVAPSAKTIGLEFDRFDLNAGDEVYVYDPAKSVVLGAFTEANEAENGELAIEPVLGDRVVVELVQALDSTSRPSLRIGKVVHDYRNVLDHIDMLTSQPLTRACEVDINCPQGAPYQTLKHAVVRVLNGGALCSAGLLNNTNEDGTPYMLTANHCGSMTNVVALFNYEYNGCGSGGTSNPNQGSVSGATLLRADANFDSQLYRLNQTPPKSYLPYYAGWTQSSAPKGPMVGIHHASGAPKKLSIDNSAAGATTAYFTVTWDIGILYGGSSGSPLYDGNLRTVGPACCVSNFTCGSQTANYGRFGKFYNQKNLAQWLDPTGIAKGVCDGMYAYEPEALPFNGAGVNPAVYSSTLPALGTTWVGTIDTTGDPSATTTILLAYARKATTSVAQGQLLVDLSSPKVFQTTSPVVGGVSTHSTNIPNDPGLARLFCYTQAVIVGSTSAQLTNGIKLRLN